MTEEERADELAAEVEAEVTRAFAALWAAAITPAPGEAVCATELGHHHLTAGIACAVCRAVV